MRFIDFLPCLIPYGIGVAVLMLGVLLSASKQETKAKRIIERLCIVFGVIVTLAGIAIAGAAVFVFLFGQFLRYAFT